jgi:DNA-directed RNA polymerase II subunit RPB2
MDNILNRQTYTSNKMSKIINNNAINNSYDVLNNPYIEDPWTIIESYFKDQHLDRLVRHQLESYNNFVGYQIIKTIEMFNPIHIKSENDFDAKSGKYSLEIFITFENFHIYRPQIHENNGAIKLMFPQEARLRNFTYASAMTIDINIKYVIRDGENLENVKTMYKTLPKIHIGKLPIMLKSNICVLSQYKYVDSKHTGECNYDAGGYFIINGSEKTVLGQERAAENRVYCFNISKNDTKYTWKAEIKSVPDFKCISPKQINMMISSKNNGFGMPICLQIPRIKQPIPLFIVFRALGIIPDKEICEYILLNISLDKYKSMLDNLQASIIEANKYMTYDDAVKYITSHVSYTPINMDKDTGALKKHEFTLEVLENDLFPHCQTLNQKIYFLGYMANKLLQASFEWIKGDDRDSYINKRIDLTGTSLNNLFRNYFNKLVKDMEKQIIKEVNNGSWRSSEDYSSIINLTNIYKIVKSNTIENGFKRALSTGDFGIKHTNSNKVGVAQVLNRLTYVASLSHLRRVSTPTDKSGKLVPPRKLHNTSWGFCCPAETPEGASVGIVKNMSYMAHITIHSNSISLYEYVEPHIIALKTLKPSQIYDKVKVFINGCWTGISEDPESLYILLKEMKYKGIINIYTSIIFDYRLQEIRICNDSGRFTRPLLRVKDRNIVITDKIINDLKANNLSWDDLLTNCKIDESVIEYIDPEEQSFSMIATKPKNIVETNGNNVYNFTHCEIHPSTIFGVVASCIPYPDHNQSPRNTYQCAQAKQAMGVYATNFNERMDKTAYVLSYSTRPLVDTRVMNLIKLNEIPSGCNINVAIMTHTGYNQEDSLLVNKGSIDRGLLQITISHTEKDEDKQKINGDEEIRCKPDPAKTKGMKFGNYNKVNSKGVVPENTLIENRDIIISKVTPIKENRNDHTKVIKYEDGSKQYRTVEETYIDKNYIDRNGDGYSFAKVRLRSLRKPVIGDKFSSRHGQKGTVGNIIPEEDMPFTKDGVRPDIIINPHAIPSRMTIGQLKETLLGKVLVELGLFGDGTSFGELDVSTISQKLLDLGYEAHGNELMYNGLTGEQIECSVFMGPVFYQRLKHMVNDKQHSRSIGPMVNLTRQPAEGRSRDGGLRFGEMEKDAMVSHGAARFTRGRMYDASDKFSVYVCKKCGIIASYNDQLHIHCCRTCDNRVDFAYVEIPYACKLLFQELTTMNVVPRIMTEH